MPRHASILRVPLSVALSAVLLASSLYGAPPPAAAGPTEWPAYLGGTDSAHYSALQQIDRSNVAELEVAWTYHAGGVKEGRLTNIQCNPLVRDGVLYGTNPELTLFALNAATGEELWTWRPPQEVGDAPFSGTNRGVAYWQSADGDDRRILYAAGKRLYAVNARTGKAVPGFGEAGSVSLHIGLPASAHELYIASTTPGVVFEDLLIFGSTVSESIPATPGDIRAIDVRTGELVWTFHTIPHPGEPGVETWPAGAHLAFGAANNWAGMSLDPKRGLVFVPLGSAAYDFYGANRPGMNLYANCLVALEARTGKLRWYYQTVHHDIWDRDLPMPPNLLRIVHEGKRRDVVVQLTKSAYIFVFDRDTGEPIFPIEEVPVPASDLPGEVAWPTQPIPVRPPQFSRGSIDPEKDVTNVSPEYAERARQEFRRLRIGTFVPPSREGTVVFPGFDGGGEWGGAATDPETGMLYVNGSEVAWLLRMVEVGEGKSFDTTADLGRFSYARYCASCHGGDRGGDPLGQAPSLAGIGERSSEAEMSQIVRLGRNRMPGTPQLDDRALADLLDFLLGRSEPLPQERRPRFIGRPTEHQRFVNTGYIKLLDPDGNPLVSPPWGRLSAVDLNRGEIRWQVTLGELPELTARGLPPTGTENYGGPVVTRGGLIFIAATKDRMFRAFDTETGKVLWQHELPAGGYATPATYEAGGRQYVVIAAGGGRLGPPSSDAYLAFALPQRGGTDE